MIANIENVWVRRTAVVLAVAAYYLVMSVVFLVWLLFKGFAELGYRAHQVVGTQTIRGAASDMFSDGIADDVKAAWKGPQS